jgi:hypothetical protein
MQRNGIFKREIGAFGTLEPRWKEGFDEDAEHVGPGSYLSQDMLEKFKVQRPNEESAPFRGPARKPLNDVHYDDRDLPGPTDYAAPVVNASPRKKGYGRPFDVNEQRFKTLAPKSHAPGVGTYEMPSSLEIKEPKLPAASMRSGAARAPT